MGVIYTRSNNDDRMFGDGICLSKSSGKLLCMWLACTYLALQLILDIDLAKPKEHQNTLKYEWLEKVFAGEEDDYIGKEIGQNDKAAVVKVIRRRNRDIPSSFLWLEVVIALSTSK